MIDLLALMRSAFLPAARGKRASIITLLTLTVGMAVSVAVFTIVNGILLQPLPFPHAERLLLLWEQTADAPQSSVSYPNYLDWRTSATTMDEMAAFKVDRFTVRLGGRADEVDACLISSQMLPLLGAQPFLGSGFSTADDRDGGGRTVLLSWPFWNRISGGDRAIVGKGLVVDGRLFTIAGVMPPQFHVPFAPDAQIWMPFGPWIGPQRLQNRGNRAGLSVIARTRPGVDLAAVRRDADRIGGTLAAEYPAQNGGHTIAAEPLREAIVAEVRPTLLLLLAGAAAVLLIACSNAATIVLARTTARQHDLTVKLALGATPATIVAEVLAEIGVLAGIAAVLALAVSAAAVHLLQRTAYDLPRLDAITLDPAVFLFAVAAAVVAVAIAGLGPALRASRNDPAAVLKENRSGPARGSMRARASLLALQFAATTVLLVAAALVVRSFVKIRQADLGFSPDGLLTLKISLPAARYQKDEGRVRFQDELLRRLAVRRTLAAVASPLPLDGTTWTSAYVTEGKSAGAERTLNEVELASVSPAYLSMLHIRLRDGRIFTAEDRWTGRPIVVVDESFARREWPGRPAVGNRLKLSRDPGGSMPWFEVVGVVSHVRSHGMETPPRVQAYLPYWEKTSSHFTLIVPAGERDDAVAGAIAAEVRAIDADVPLFAVRRFDEYENDVLLSKRLATTILVVFGVAAVALALFGLYGLISYSLALRQRELGIRLAIGASPGRLFLLVVLQTARMAALGVGAGLLAALALTPRMQPLLFAVDPHDFLSFALVAVALLACSVLATAVPAGKTVRRTPQALLKAAAQY